MKKILFTGGGGAGNEALFRLLGDRYEMHFADADLQAIDPAIPTARRHLIPFANHPEFGKTVCELIQNVGIDLLVPGVDEELALVADLAEKGALCAMLPPSTFVRRHLDKLTSMRCLDELDLAPKTVLAEEGSTLGFPCIVKPRSGRGSRGVSVISSAKKLAAYLALSEAGEGGCIAQELGEGIEFTVMMVADSGGRLRAVVPVEVGIKRGITLRARTGRNAAVEAACRAVHASDPVAGCYNIQLIHQEDGRILIFEINPRVSTTMCLGVAAGVDPMEIFLSESSEEGGSSFRENVSLRRTWVNHFEEGESNG